MGWLNRERKAGNISTIIEVVGVLLMLGILVYYVLT